MFLNRLAVILLVFLLVGANSVYADQNPSYDSVSPTNDSSLTNFDVNFTIAYTKVGNVNDAIISISDTSASTGFTNFTATGVNNATAFYISTTTYSQGIWYKWYINSSSVATNYNVTGVYQNEFARLTGLLMVMNELPGLMGSIVGLVVSVAVIILLLVIVAWLKGMFKNFDLGKMFGRSK